MTSYVEVPWYTTVSGIVEFLFYSPMYVLSCILVFRSTMEITALCRPPRPFDLDLPVPLVVLLLLLLNGRAQLTGNDLNLL